MAVKNPIFKILRCPDCGKQNWHTELLSPVPPCSKCGAAAAYSSDWYIKVIVEGKRHIQAIGRTKQHAESALKKAEAEIFYDTYQINQESPLLSTATTTLYDARWSKKKDGNGTKRRAELLQDIIGDIPIGTISKKHMQLLSRTLSERGTGSSTANKYRSVLRSILKYHNLSYAFIDMDPEVEGRIRVITDKEEETAIKLLSEKKAVGRYKFYSEMPDLCICLVDTGLRLSELLDLPAKDINFKTGMLTSWKNKADKPRSVPMTKRVKDILKKRVGDDQKPLFAIDIYQADNAWAWVREQMGLKEDEDFVLHAWRHTCATRLLIAGVDVYRVKEWLGHKSLKTTERYIHLAPHNLKEALQALEKRKQSTKRQQKPQLSDK